MSIFNVEKIKYEGPKSTNPLSFKYYNADEVVGGKTMREQLRFAMSYWHTLCGNGPAYAENKYDQKLKAAYEKHKA